MNRLGNETSPYLLQHADNPVDWHPWGEEALERARAEDRPILLSIGYAACHWCHVMEHESFEDAGTAALMNELFVNVKVDREERPDLDSIYMDAVVALTGHGGWPMTVFLTPEGEPFYGGTYYPPEPKHGLPSFRQVLEAVAGAYRERRADVARSARELVEAVRRGSEAAPSRDPLTESILRDAVRALRTQFDTRWGGFGRAPKFPPASALEFLLRMHRRGDEDALALVTQTLDGMAAGGMYDLVGGGFHRYSVDDRWLVPHFEKMLYDNAQLASTYLHAWVVTGQERYRTVAERTLEYVLRELSLPGGGFASSQDADTEGVEGLTFTWTAAELAAAAGPGHESLLQPFEHGRSVVRGELDEDLRSRLLEARERRPKPARDDKAIAAWNGLLLAALAEAGRRLERDDLLAAARRLAEFLLGPLSDAEGRLLRSFRAGRAKTAAYLEDYADVANGLIELHVATGELRWLEEAHRLAQLAVTLFADEDRGGFFMTASDAEKLVARKKDFDDHPTPSGNSMLASALLRLGRIHGDEELERRAVSVFRLVHRGLASAPSAFGHALCALDLHFSAPRELAIVGPPTSRVARAALAGFDPTTVVAVSAGAQDEAAQRIPLLAGKDLVDGRPAVYVCERFACRRPATDPGEL
ncbi:MAG: thioredoxin domain-containing protein [Gaiellaceae bacterium]